MSEHRGLVLLGTVDKHESGFTLIVRQASFIIILIRMSLDDLFRLFAEFLVLSYSCSMCLNLLLSGLIAASLIVAGGFLNRFVEVACIDNGTLTLDGAIVIAAGSALAAARRLDTAFSLVPVKNRF